MLLCPFFPIALIFLSYAGFAGDSLTSDERAFVNEVAEAWVHELIAEHYCEDVEDIENMRRSNKDFSDKENDEVQPLHDESSDIKRQQILSILDETSPEQLDTTKLFGIWENTRCSLMHEGPGCFSKTPTWVGLSDGIFGTSLLGGSIMCAINILCPTGAAAWTVPSWACGIGLSYCGPRSIACGAGCVESSTKRAWLKEHAIRKEIVITARNYVRCKTITETLTSHP